MKIFLTGNTGMVGKNILDHVEAIEYEFLTPNRKELDLENQKEVDDYIRINQPDMVIHAAGLVGGIHTNMANPVNFLVRNMDIGRNVIMGAKNNNVKQLLNLASSCIYPKFAENPLKENVILKGELEPTNEGYALAKIMAMRLCDYIVREDSSFNYKTIIPCNLYGKYDKFSPQHSHMIPAVIAKIHEAKINNDSTVEIWGTGEARREFMYAGDLADFIFYAINNFEKLPQLTNVGLGTDLTINDYYKEISGVIGFKGDFVHDTTKPIGMFQKVIDNSKLKIFGWAPKTSLKDGITQTYEFYKKSYLND